jgi:predicted ATPase
VDQPVVTITGPGGVGKTRLALHAAANVADDFVGGVTVVEFARLRDQAGVAQVIAHALDIQQRQHRTLDATIEDYLASRHALLVLDNCEHVIEVLAPLVDRLRAGCPKLRILATSREPLGLAGEYVHVVAPLDLPARGASRADEVSRSPAVELFVARAATATTGFTLTDDNAAAVADICRRLDGLPLGLELAAARLRAMGVEPLAERLRQRIQALGQAQRSADGRHRTLLDLMQWSYDLLEPEERQAFVQLAVFAGGFDLAAAKAICVITGAGRLDASDILAGLVDKSMVILVDPQVPRYRLLEPLREFGLDRLSEAGTLDAVEGRHCDWFLDVAERGAVGLDGPDEATWAESLDRDFDNFRAAHRVAIRTGDAYRALRLVVCLREFAFRRIQYEVTTWADAAAALPGAEDQPDLPIVLAVSAYGRWVRGDIEAAIRLAHQALDAEREHVPSDSGLPERVLGNAHFYLGHVIEALQWMDKMVLSARHSGSQARLAHGLYMQSVARTSLGDHVKGAIRAGEARAAAAASGSPSAMAQALYALGLALEGPDPDGALVHLERAAQVAASAGNRWIEGFSLTEVHWMRARRGAHVAGLAGFADVVDIWHRGGDWANQWLSLRHVFGILIDLGAYEVAAVLHGALTAVGAANALPFEPAVAERLADDVRDLRSLLGATTFAEAVRQGASMSDSEIVEFARSQIEALAGHGAASRPTSIRPDLLD